MEKTESLIWGDNLKKHYQNVGKKEDKDENDKIEDKFGGCISQSLYN